MPESIPQCQAALESQLQLAGHAVRATLAVPAAASGQYLDRYAASVLAQLPSKCSARKAAKRGELLVNGAVAAADYRVNTGDCLTLLDSRRVEPVFALALKVIWEDEHLAVIEKPPGFPVSGNCHRSIEHALPANLSASGCRDALIQARPVHRLDAATGGVLLTAKTAQALMELSRQFQCREVRKCYRALVTGRLDADMVVETPVDGRAARSRVVVCAHSRSLHTDWVTSVELHPETGRTHQLRQHLAGSGHPIVGDSLYGEPGKTLHGKGLFLWAVELAFRHPSSGLEIVAKVTEPAKFASYRRREQRRWDQAQAVGSVTS